MREAEEEMKEIVAGWQTTPRGQFHCFAGSTDFLEQILNLGFYVSFCGNVTFKKADSLRELVKKTTPERLLLETDSPYLAPEPIRGSINEPANVKIITEYIAQLRGDSFSKIAEKTSNNAVNVYFSKISN